MIENRPFPGLMSPSRPTDPVEQLLQRRSAAWLEYMAVMRSHADPSEVAAAAQRWQRLDVRARRATRFRSRRLLLSLLDDRQRKAFARTKRFIVTGSQGGRYRINAREGIGNIVAVNGRGRTLRQYCIVFSVTSGGVVEIYPTYDTIAAQVLMLRNDERRFLELACRL